MELYRDPYSHNNPKLIDLAEIESITPADYGLTPEAIKASMFGVKVVDPSTGNEMGDSFYTYAIETAISKIETELDIVILPRLVTEHKDYNYAEYSSYMFLHAKSKPILQVEELGLEANGSYKRNYPSEWWKVYNRPGHIQVASAPLYGAIGGHVGGGIATFTGGVAFGGYGDGLYSGYGGGLYSGYGSLPNGSSLGGYKPNPVSGGNQNSYPQLIHVSYIAGMLPQRRAGVTEEWEMPTLLNELIVKMASKQIFQQWGRLVVPMGVASKSLTIDGISESVSYTSSATNGAIKSEISQLDEDISDGLNKLRGYYGNGFISV